MLLLVCSWQYSETSSLLTKKLKHFKWIFDDIEPNDDDNSTDSTSSSFVFRPVELEKEMENEDYDYDNLEYEVFDSNSTSSETNTTKPKHLDAIFEFVQYFLEPSEVYQNTVYEATANQNQQISFEEDSEDK